MDGKWVHAHIKQVSSVFIKQKGWFLFCGWTEDYSRLFSVHKINVIWMEHTEHILLETDFVGY